MTFKELNIKAIIDAVFNKKLRLTPELLNKITDSGTSTYDIVKLLCVYINSTNQIERKDDLTSYCEMAFKVEDLRNQNKRLYEKYNKAMSELLVSKENEIKLARTSTNCELQMSQLRRKIKDLESQIEVESLIKRPD